MTPHVLILGGTTESRQLAERLSVRLDMRVTLSLAGRTVMPHAHPVPTRSGGFGGVEGLINYLRDERVACLVDATHPFARQISQNARAAIAQTGTQLIALRRRPWVRQPGDRWVEVTDAARAVEALGVRPRRVFVTIGRQGLHELLRAPQHYYWIRTVDPVTPALALGHAQYIVERGPFAQDREESLLRADAIEILVAKNSGGEATYGKIAAARKLGLPVVMIGRAAEPEHALAVDSVEAAVRHVVDVLGLGMERGV